MEKPLTENLTEIWQQRSILVTGAHRSGTTWVGKMLAANDQIGYISEPLNVWHRPGVMRIPVKHWYTYICKENEEIYSKAFEETISFQYHTTKEFQSLKSFKDIIRMVRDWNSFTRGRIKQQRVLVKDPFAVFSSIWFFERLGFEIVITVRHPAAIASSLKRLNWSFDFSDLLEQPLLIRDLLSPFYDELVEMVVSQGVTQPIEALFGGEGGPAECDAGRRGCSSGLEFLVPFVFELDRARPAGGLQAPVCKVQGDAARSADIPGHGLKYTAMSDALGRGSVEPPAQVEGPGLVQGQLLQPELQRAVAQDPAPGA